MNTCGNAFKKVIFGLLILVCTLGTAPAADSLLDMLPGDALFCVRINDLGGTLAKLDQYLIGVSPMGTAMLVNMQLAGIVGDPMLNGINMNGNFAVIGLPDMTVGLLVPVTNFSDFVKNNPNCTQTPEGFAVLSPPSEETGNYALMEAGGGKYAIVVPESLKNSLTELKAALSNPASTLTARLNADQSQEAVSAPVWAYANLSTLYNQFSPMVMMQMQQAEQEISTAMGGAMGEEFGKVYLQIYQEMFKLFVGQADSATLAITPEPTKLMLDVSLRAKDGSELAQMMVPDPSAAQGFKYAGYLDSSYAVNALMKWNPQSMGEFYDKIFDMLAAAKPDAAMKDSVSKMKTMMQQWLPIMGDEVALSFSYAKGQPPIMLQEVFGIKDSTAMEAMMQESMAMVDNVYAAMGLPMTFKYQPNVGTYKNATLDRITVSFSQENNADDPMMTAINQLYGEGLTYTAAHTDNTYFVTMGNDSEADVKKLIDETPSAAPTGEVKAALDLFKGTPYNEGVASINIIKLITGLGDLMQSMGPMIAEAEGQNAPLDIFSGLNLPSQSSLAIGAYSGNGQTKTRMILPKQHLMEIMNAVMQIQQKVNQQMQEMMMDIQVEPAPQP